MSFEQSIEKQSQLPPIPNQRGSEDQALKGNGFNESQDDSVIEQRENLDIRVIGRIAFSDGGIDASSVTSGQFQSTLDFIKNHGLVSITDINTQLIQDGEDPIQSIFDIPGLCIDGRGNQITLAGKQVAIARPKVVGAPPVYNTTVGSIVQVPQFQGKDRMIDRFSTASRLLGKSSGMHESCGMAAGTVAVLTKYHDNFNEMQESTTELTRGALILPNDMYDETKRGISDTIERAESQSDEYNEPAMIRVVREQQGDNAIVKLIIDHNHPNHSHEEGGLGVLFSPVADIIMVKDAVNSNPDIPDIFYHNAKYGFELNDRLVGPNNPRLQLQTRIVGLQLPIAAVATLGKNQWLGSIGDPRLAIGS